MTSEATNPATALTTAWPPPSLTAINVVALVNDCEEAEMHVAAAANRPFANLVHLIALLYIGDYAAVQQLLHRIPAQSRDALLEEWINVVAMPMLEKDSTRALLGLQHVSGNSPAPLNQYAQEVASLYLQRQENAKNGSAAGGMNTNVGGHVIAFLEATQLST